MVTAIEDSREFTVGASVAGSLLDQSTSLSAGEIEWREVLGAETLGDSVYVLATRIWALEGREHLAVELFWAAGELGVDRALLDFAECLMWLGERREAVGLLADLAEDSGDIAKEAKSLLVSAQLEDGLSVEIADAILDLRPGATTRPFLRLQLAKLLLQSKGEDEAVAILTDLSATGDAEAAITLGNFYWDVSGDIARAEAAYVQGAKAGDAHCWYNLGQLQLRHQRPHEGLASLRAAVGLGDGAAKERLRELGEW